MIEQTNNKKDYFLFNSEIFSPEDTKLFVVMKAYTVNFETNRHSY